MEIQVRDKLNARRKLILSEGRREMVKNQTHCKMPSSFIQRDQWVNFCIDLNSIVEECFSGTPASNKEGNRSGSQGKNESSKVKTSDI